MNPISACHKQQATRLAGLEEGRGRLEETANREGPGRHGLIGCDSFCRDLNGQYRSTADLFSLPSQGPGELIIQSAHLIRFENF